MTADDNQVRLEFFCQGVNFHLRPTHDDVAMSLVDPVALGETIQLLGGLLVDFVLDAGKIHRDIAAVSKAEGLYNMNDMQLRRRAAGNRAGPLENPVGILAEIDGDQDLSIIRHESTP